VDQSGARELGEQIASRVPRWRFADWMEEPRVPILGPGRDDCCPQCGRLLPCSLSPGGALDGGRGTQFLTDALRVSLCLVDGHRAEVARNFRADEITEAAVVIESALRSHHWRSWARLIRRATRTTRDGSGEQLEAVGQALEGIRACGPFAFCMQRIPDGVIEGRHVDVNDLLDVLVVSTARFWPDRRPYR